MLVLSRGINQRLIIGDNIVVTIVRIGPNTVRLGIDAPTDVNIAREEVYEPRGSEESLDQRLGHKDRGDAK